MNATTILTQGVVVVPGCQRCDEKAPARQPPTSQAVQTLAVVIAFSCVSCLGQPTLLLARFTCPLLIIRCFSISSNTIKAFIENGCIFERKFKHFRRVTQGPYRRVSCRITTDLLHEMSYPFVLYDISIEVVGVFNSMGQYKSFTEFQ
jgi:hypothetical protein